MKNILLIGVGRFGRHIAMHLNQLGHQVMAVDRNEERIDAVMPYVTNAQIGDSVNADFLRSLGVGNYDVCIVTIGSSFQDSLETACLLKELGAKWVVSRAERDVQEKFLLRNGADQGRIRENLKMIQQAIEERVQIRFRFYGYNRRKELEPVRKEKDTVSPYYLVANGGK